MTTWPLWLQILAGFGAAALLVSFAVGVLVPLACWLHDRRAARHAR